MNFRKQILPHIGTLPDYVVRVSQFRQPRIAYPCVCVYDAARLDRSLDSVLQAGCRGIGYPLKTDSSDAPTIFLGCYDNQLLLRCSTTSFAWFFSADVTFVYFDYARKAIPPRPYHHTTQLMQPCPRGMITAQTKHPLQAQSIGTILLTCHMPNRTKPKTQWLLGVLKNCASKNRCLQATPFAMMQTSFCQPILGARATRASKSIGPSAVGSNKVGMLPQWKTIVQTQAMF